MFIPHSPAHLRSPQPWRLWVLLLFSTQEQTSPRQSSRRKAGDQPLFLLDGGFPEWRMRVRVEENRGEEIEQRERERGKKQSEKRMIDLKKEKQQEK